MELNLSLLTQLRAFEAVGRHASFVRASEALHVTPSALSHHVRHLEADLGVPLLRRLHRGVELTAEGQRLCADCTRGFEALAGALRPLRQGAEDQTLTVSVAPFFSACWLTPRLGRWWARHPQIDLHLRHAYAPADFLHDRVAAGISWGHGAWPEAVATRVLSGELAVVCNPVARRTLRRRPAPADLLNQRLLCEFDPAHWQSWFEAAGLPGPHRLDIVQIDDSHALRRAALDGHGFALFVRGLLQEDLRSGQLVQPFDITVDPGSAYWFVRPRGRPVGRQLAAFSKWLLHEVASEPLA